MAAKTKNPLGPGLLRFLAELRKNNKKPWFEKNKVRYEEEVREPALAFIRAMEPAVEKVSPHLMAIDKKVGGSLMRVHRDVRFSKDKSPYKTNLGIQFRHERGKDVHAPGLYVHVEPETAFLAAGMWHPESGALKGMREAIAADPSGWKHVRDAKRFRDVWHLEGESLKRAPRGYDEDHPMIEDLKRKDHIAVVRLRPEEVVRPDFVAKAAGHFARVRPYMAFQAAALGLPF